jgi:hypothetical protein
MRARLALAAFAALAAAPVASFAQVRAGVGADYVVNGDGIFELTLAVEARIRRGAALEARFGGFVVTSSSPTGGIPVDFGLRLTPGRAYVEALLGPWIFFRGESLRAHGEFGLGLESRDFSVGFAFGFITDANATIGAPLGFRL